jgi:hypothetical protein
MSFIQAFYDYLKTKEHLLYVRFNNSLNVIWNQNTKVATLVVHPRMIKFDLNELLALKQRWIDFVATQDSSADGNAVLIDGTTDQSALITIHHL